MEKEIEGGSERDTEAQNYREEERSNERGGNKMWEETGGGRNKEGV